MTELNETQRAVLARIVCERTHVSSDSYAAHRCECGHLTYYPGETHCRFCDCVNHRSAASEAGLPVAGRKDGGEWP